MTGLVTGLLSVVTCTSYPAVIFTGTLAEYLPIGIGLALFSAACMGVVVSCLSTFRGSVAYAQSEPALILAVTTTAIATTLNDNGASRQVLPTVLIVIALSSITYGLFHLHR